MRRYGVWAVVLIAAVISVPLVQRFSLLQLTPEQLRIANLPHAPRQMNSATIQCSRGLDIALSNANGEWRVIQDHPPCDVSGIALEAVRATPTEMATLNCRPLVSFEVSNSGTVFNIKLLRSSGSSTLDEKVLRQVSVYRYPGHNCGVCKMSMAISIDFQGPVWVREPALQESVGPTA